MRTAFKEWAIVVDALGRGEQILILRKGGIHEGKGGFQVEHRRFWLFPTLFHQQRESVISSAQARFDELPLPDATSVRIEFLAEVVGAYSIDSLETARALRGQHIWRDEVIKQRYDWGRNKGVYALVTRVYRRRDAVELPMLAEYSGCKSWIELANDIEEEGLSPVLADAEFAKRIRKVEASLQQEGTAMVKA